MADMIRNYAHIGTREEADREFQITEGQWVAGYTVGIMLLDVHYPILPGNVVNACTYDYPVRHKWVPGANQVRMHSGDDSLLPALIETAKELELEGCRAVCGACGYFGHFQRRVAEAVDIPVYLSSLIQAPWIRAGLRRAQRIGVLCADGKNLTPALFENCGLSAEDFESCVIKSAGHLPEFSAFMERRGRFDNGILRRELIDLAKGLVSENPDVGALLLECSDMPPYSADIQAAVNLPVFDFITMIDFVHKAVAQKPYYGFM